MRASASACSMPPSWPASPGSVVRLRVAQLQRRHRLLRRRLHNGGASRRALAFRTAAAGRAHVAIVPDPTEPEDLGDPGPAADRAQRQRSGDGGAGGLPALRGRSRPRSQAAAAPHVPCGWRPRSIALYLVLALISWSSTTRPAPPRRRSRASSRCTIPLSGLPNREWFRDRAERTPPHGWRGRSRRNRARRPRPFQGGQRHPRPSCRRRAAPRGGAAAARLPAHRRRRRAPRRR